MCPLKSKILLIVSKFNSGFNAPKLALTNWFLETQNSGFTKHCSLTNLPINKSPTLFWWAVCSTPRSLYGACITIPPSWTTTTTTTTPHVRTRRGRRKRVERHACSLFRPPVATSDRSSRGRSICIDIYLILLRAHTYIHAHGFGDKDARRRHAGSHLPPFTVRGRTVHSVSAVKSVRLIRFWNISVMTNS